VAAGFAVLWLPILGFYAAHGDLGQLVYRYVQYPIAVAGGWSDVAWQQDSHLPSPLTTMFYALPFVLAIIALALVFEVRPLRIATHWSSQRMLLAGSLIVTILLYEGGMLRADSTDMAGTLLAVPALVVVAATVLPRLLGGRRRATLIGAGVALAVASFALLPYAAYSWSGVHAVAEAPYLDRKQLAADTPASQPASLAASRVGSGLADAPDCCGNASQSMAHFIATMNSLHTIIGNRTAYVVDTPSGFGYPGIIYFVADLKPAPVQYDQYTTVLNIPQLQQYLAYFRSYVLERTQALVTPRLDAPEARDFMQRYPGARRITLSLGGAPYYVLLAPGSGH
jgi:flagellar biogenesis protein FliO